MSSRCLGPAESHDGDKQGFMYDVKISGGSLEVWGKLPTVLPTGVGFRVGLWVSKGVYSPMSWFLNVHVQHIP